MKILGDGLVIRSSALILLLGSASIVLAQSPGSPATLTVAGRVVELPVTGADAPPPEWGSSSTSVLNVNAWSFDHFSPSALVGSWEGGARYISSGTPEWIAGVSLPTGAVVSGIEVQGCDNSQAGGLQVFLTRQYITGDTEFVALVGGTFLDTGPTQMPGCGNFVQALSPATISNDGQSYFIDVKHSGVLDGSVRFQSVLIHYALQVSPAPGAATFTDVPTTHPFFKFVEALYSSGITAGCGGGNYCPDSPLTRGQMAVFLSVALGLHWPN